MGSSGYFQRRVWETYGKIRFHGRYRSSLCTGLQVLRSSRPASARLHPALAVSARCVHRAPAVQGAPSCPVSVPSLAPQHPGTTDAAPCKCFSRTSTLHRQIAYCTRFCLWREGGLLGTYFFTFKIKFSMKSGLWFFSVVSIATDNPRVGFSTLKCLSKKLFFFSP